MKYLPFEDFEIHTKLSSDEVFYRLRAAVETKETWWILINKPYFGKVTRSDFRISRVRKWWDRDFFPFISGEVQSEDSGSCVQIKVRMHWYSFMVWVVWFGFIFYKFVDGTANLVLQIIQTGTWKIELVWQFLPLIGMFAFGYILVMNDIKPETKRYKDFLINLLEVDLVNIVNRDRIFGMTESQIIKSLFLLTFIASLGLIIYNLLR